MCIRLRVKDPLFLLDCNRLNFLGRFSKSTQMSKFMKILSVGAESFHADGRPERRDEANHRFLQFCKRAQKLRFV